MRKRWGFAVLVAGALAALVLLRTGPADFWDFKFYMVAGRAWALGQSPYGLHALDPICTYNYLPLVLDLFRPLVWFDQVTGAGLLVWCALKLGVLIWLVSLWQSTGLMSRSWASALFCVFGFHGTIFTDLKAGNISIFETGLVFLALSWSPRVPAGVFAAAGAFKFLPSALSLLCGVRVAALTSAVLAAWILVNWLYFPDFLAPWIHSLLEQASSPRLVEGPSTLLVLQRYLGQHLGWISYLTATIGLAFAVWRYRNSRWNSKAGAFIAVSVALAMPRLKDYALITWLPFAWAVAVEGSRGKRRLLGYGLLGLSVLPGVACWVALTGIWAAGFYDLKKKGSRPTTS